MKSAWFYALAVAALLVIAFGAHVATLDASSAKRELDLARSQTTAEGLYVAAIEPEDPGIRQGVLHSWVLTVKTADGKPVEDARIAVDGGMPDHGHGLPTRPKLRDALGDGRYVVDGMKFNMGGYWVVDLAIAAPAGEDTVRFELNL